MNVVPLSSIFQASKNAVGCASFSGNGLKNGPLLARGSPQQLGELGMRASAR
jgi:hypothetical protein